MSPSRLWGREQSEMHAHYGPDGVLTGVTVIERSPEFTSEDVAWLLASKRIESDLGPHGIPMSEAMDPANQFAFEANEKPRTDFAAATIGRAQDAYYATRPKNEARHGHKWYVKRRDG